MTNVSLFFVFLLFLEGVSGETVSVKEGQSATLPGPKEIKADDVIDWRFGDILIARVRKSNIPTTYEDELNGVFKGRLKLDGKTGALTVLNTKTTDAGNYEVSNSINTFRKNVILRVDSGLSSGAIAGIVLAVVVVVAAVVGGIYYGYWKKKQMI